MRKVTKEEFVDRSTAKHNGKYDYSLVEYKDTHHKVDIICPIHGVFSQRPYAHMSRGLGCNQCGIVNRTVTTVEFVERANCIHNNRYDYSQTVYTHNKQRVAIVCTIHGVFNQKPNDHLNGSGCPLCNNKQSDVVEFIKKAKLIHGDRYDYSCVNYVNNKTAVTIICSIHGPFQQVPDSHINRYCGCRKCGNKISLAEREWLTYLQIPDTPAHRQVRIDIGGTIVYCDGYNPLNNTVYEFYGDGWHGNPAIYVATDIPISHVRKTAGELWQATLQREELIRNAGYTLVTMWGSEWNKIKRSNNTGEKYGKTT